MRRALHVSTLALALSYACSSRTAAPVASPAPKVGGEPAPSSPDTPTDPRAAAKQAAVEAEARNKRLDALRKSLKSGTSAGLWETAASAEKQKNWKEAKEAYQSLAVHHPKDDKAMLAAERATVNAFRLSEYGEGLTWQEDAIALFAGTVDEARLERSLGRRFLEIPHWGTRKGGELHRGRYDQGIWEDTHRLDRSLAIRHLERSRELFIKAVQEPPKPGDANPNAHADLARERLDAEFDLVAALARFTPFDGSWGYWYYAWNEAAEDELVEDEGSDERAGRWGGRNALYSAQPRGMPVDPEGNVVFTPRPPAWSPQLSDTAKIKFLLHEVGEADPTPDHDYQAEALWRQALLFRSRDGAERLQRLESWWWNGSNPYKSVIESKKPWNLADDEVLGLIATHIGVYKVPEDENPLRLFRQIGNEFPKAAVAERAALAVGQFYQSRQQYDRAIASYNEYLQNYPKGALRQSAQPQLDEIRKPELKLEDAGTLAAGAPPAIPLEYRNVHHLFGRAMPVDTTRLVKRFEEDWTNTRQDWSRIQLESPGSYLLQEDKGQNFEKFSAGPWREFTLDVVDDGTHRYRKSDEKIPVTDPGLWVIEIFNDAAKKTRLSQGLVMLETTAVVDKHAKNGELFWVVDTRTGTPISDADVEVFEYWSDWEPKATQPIKHNFVTHLKTNAEGLTRFHGDSGHQRLLTIRKGNRFAYSGDGYFYGYSPSVDQEGYLGLVFTDRPVYRPLHTVKFQVWARKKENGKYLDASAARTLHVEIWDPKGVKVMEKSEPADDIGSAGFEYTLPKAAALGMYRIDLQADGNGVSVGGNQFRVEEYKAPEFEVSVSVGDGPARLGTAIPVKIGAEYYFGGAVEGGRVHYKVFRTEYHPTYSMPGRWDWLYGAGYGRCYYAYPWFPWWAEWGPRRWFWYPWWGPEPKETKELVKEGSGRLDTDGKLSFTLDTSKAAKDFGDQDQQFEVEAEVTDESRRTIKGSGEVLATRHEFASFVETDRGYYDAGQTIRMEVATLKPAGDPLATSGEVRIQEVLFRGDNGDTVDEKPIVTSAAKTDSDGRLHFDWDVKKPGQYRLSYVAKDAWGTEVIGSTVVWVWGPGFDGKRFRFNHLEVITDRRTYAVGDTARILITSNIAGASVLFSPRVDNGTLLDPQVLTLEGKTRVVKVPITAADVPNFFVEATLVAAGKLSEEAREIFVPPPAAELEVSLRPKQAEWRAGKPGEMEVVTTGPDGKPMPAEVAVSVYDKSVLYIQPELTPDARKQFWGQLRTHSVESTTNLKRRYETWQWLTQPDQLASNLLAADLSGSMPSEVDFLSNKDDELEGRAGKGGAVAYHSAPAKEADARAAEEPASGERMKSLSKVRRQSIAIIRGEADKAPAPSQPEAGVVQPTVRRNFADTAAWRVVHTDATGHATVSWTFPDNLTTWRAKAIGLTASTQVGEATASMVTTQKLLVRLQAPRFFRERDRVVISANVHNRLASDKSVTVTLDVPDALLKLEGPQKVVVTVPKNTEKRVDFWVTVHGEGEAKVRVSALTDEESDAKEMTFPVLVHGMLKTVSQVGSISASEKGDAEKSLTFEVPKARRPEMTELTVRWSPTLAGAMIDSLPFLLDYPYGCTEQTMSRFVPAVLTRKALQDMGGFKLEDLDKIRESLNPQHISGGTTAYRERLEREYQRFDRNPVYNSATMNDMIAEGLARIEKMEQSDGGWGWWGSDRSSIYTTAYVLWGLWEAKQADVGIPEALLTRGRESMRAQLPEHLAYYDQHEWVSDTDAFFAYVMSLFGDKDDKLNGYLFERRQRLSVYGQSLFSLALWNLGRRDDARLLLRNAAQFLKEDPENETAWIETRQEGWWWWWNSDIESNATFLRAVVAVDPSDARAPKLIKWLLNHRKNGWYWNSTRDTAITVASFAHYMRAAKERETAYDLDVVLDGKVAKTVHIDKTNLLTFDGELRLVSSEVDSGKHTLTFRRRGKGAVYFNSYLTYFTLEEDVPAAGLEIKVDRRYYKLERENRTVTAYGQRGQEVPLTEAAYRKVPLKTGDTVASGDLILVELMLESKNDYSFLAFEDPKPAGFEAVALRSGYTFGEAVANLELRDEKVVFFLADLNQGKLKLEYRLRAEIPGTFHAMPTYGYAMYAPELRANSAEMRLGVTEAETH
jgi:alpha-2-macroglobulin